MDITNTPSQTLYVKAINEKIKKNELRKQLYNLFSQFGTILDVVALKTIKMRGQAFIAFKDVTQATAALRALQGYPFYDKALKIAYSKEMSHVIARAEGSLKGPISASKSDGAGTKRAREDEENDGHPSKRVANGKQQDVENDSGSDMEASDDDEAPPQPINKATNSGDDPDARNPPNNILFLKNIPGNITQEMLSMLFQQYPGFKEVRLVSSSGGKGTGDVGFVEYENESQAQVAKGVLHGFKLAQNSTLSVFFAKK
ncbi:U2 small nuclear ribonucleoprotein B''-like protein [Cladochytrium replicatum]|nr:U2 small nuclear ribonucleoprotein B''-like protein [Cladochytrium replicatum]